MQFENDLETRVAEYGAEKSVDSALLRAVFTGDKQACEHIIELGATPDARNEKGKPALVIAAEENHREVAKLLLKRSADVNECDDEGRSALHIACNRGFSGIVTLLLKAGTNPDAKAIDGRTPLYEAVESQRLHLVQLLIDHGVDIESVGPKGDPPLHAAVSKGVTNLPMLRVLITGGADMNVRDTNGQTVLHAVAIKGSVEIAKVLIESSADIEARDSRLNTPLINAARNQNMPVMQLLIDKRANLEAMTVEGMTALNVAVFRANAGQIIRKLISSGANVETKTSTDDGEFTPLMRASKQGQNNLVKILCEHADVNARDKRGWTTLHILADKGNRETADFLRGASLKLDTESRDITSMTPTAPCCLQFKRRYDPVLD